MAEKPEDLIPTQRWAGEVHISPGMIGNVADARYVFKMVVGDLIDSIFAETGDEPVDMKIRVQEIRSGDYDSKTFQEMPMPGWRCRIEGEKRRFGRQAIE